MIVLKSFSTFGGASLPVTSDVTSLTFTNININPITGIKIRSN